jgi:hypothetical protein
MPKRPRTDPILMAKHVLDRVIEIHEKEPLKNPAAVALGKLGGVKGGVARAKALSPERRAEIAKRAAERRWGAKKSS